jgi:hypothetical protein
LVSPVWGVLKPLAGAHGVGTRQVVLNYDRP